MSISNEPARLAALHRYRILDTEPERAGEVVITVRDPGGGFDHTAVPDPLDPQNILEPSGRGIFLINGLMDDVHFTDGGRDVRMRKKKA